MRDKIFSKVCPHAQIGTLIMLDKNNDCHGQHVWSKIQRCQVFVNKSRTKHGNAQFLGQLIGRVNERGCMGPFLSIRFLIMCFV